MFDLRIGKFVLVLPFAHPVCLVKDATAVYILSNGRFDLGVGQGYAHSDFIRFALARSKRGKRLEEGVEGSRRCRVSGGPVRPRRGRVLRCAPALCTRPG